MNKKYLFQIVVVPLVVVMMGCSKADKLKEQSEFKTPTGPVELKLKWPLGERVVQDMDVKTKTVINVPGQPAPMQQDMIMGQKYALTVLKETSSGGRELEMEFLSARMRMEMGGKSMMNYDSEKKSADDDKNPMASLFGKIVGSKIQYFMDANHNLERIEGMDEMMNRLSEGTPNAALAPLKSVFSEGYFKQLMSSSTFMPSNAVSPGDTWPVQTEYEMGMIGTLVTDYTFTLQGWEMHGKRNCAKLEFQGTINTKAGKDAGMTIQDGTTSGVSWFDPELGITIETVMNQDMTMNMPLPKNSRTPKSAAGQPQTMTSHLSQVITIKLDSVK